MADSVDLAPDEKVCPYCAETIKKAAIKCRFCQSDLAETPTEPAALRDGADAPPQGPAESAGVPPEDDPGSVPEEGPPGPSRRAERSGSRFAFLDSARLLIILALVNGLLLVAAGGAYWWKQRETDEPPGAITSVSARDEGLQEAATLTEKVLSYDWKKLDQDVRAAEELLAPTFRSEYAKTMAGVRDQTIKNQVQLKATVASTSVVSATPRKVVALVFVNQVTTAKGTTNARIDQSRVLVTLTRSGEEWRVFKMDAF